MNRISKIGLLGAGLIAVLSGHGWAKGGTMASEQAMKPNSVYASKQGRRLTIEQDSAVTLRLDEFISSQTAQPGDSVRFSVDRAVVAKGFVVIPRGARAFGVIKEVRPARGWGRGGKMIMDLTHVEAYDGTKVPLATTMRGAQGQDLAKTGAYAVGLMMAPVSLLVAPVGAGVKGKKIEMAEGTLFSAFLKEDVHWKLVSSRGKLSLPGSKGTSRIGEGGAMDTSLQGECMTDICAEYAGSMFRSCMLKCQAD